MAISPWGEVLVDGGAALRHRIVLNFEGEAEGITTQAVIEEALGAVE